jgi:hypothetical protein
MSRYDDDLDDDDDDDLEDDDDLDDDVIIMGPERCETCQRLLTRGENRRFYEEIEAWTQKHPTDWLDVEEISEDSGIAHDCDSCAASAARRLLFAKQREENKTFMDRVANGGNEGFILVALVILGVMVLALASGR